MLVFPDFNKQRLLLYCTHFEETEIEADFRDYKSGQERLHRGSLLQIGAKRIKNQGKDYKLVQKGLLQTGTGITNRYKTTVSLSK